MDDIAELGRLLADNPDVRPPRLVFGVVTQASPLKVDFTGSGVGTTVSSAAIDYTPAVGHTVAAIQQGAIRHVLHRVRSW